MEQVCHATGKLKQGAHPGLNPKQEGRGGKGGGVWGGWGGWDVCRDLSSTSPVDHTHTP